MFEIQKCPNFNYFAIILQYYLYKKCRKIKNVWIWSEGGGSAIFKNVWNSKKSEISDGEGGSSLFGNFSQIFPVFFFMMAPLSENFFTETQLLKQSHLNSLINVFIMDFFCWTNGLYSNNSEAIQLKKIKR